MTGLIIWIIGFMYYAGVVYSEFENTKDLPKDHPKKPTTSMKLNMWAGVLLWPLLLAVGFEFDPNKYVDKDTEK